MSVYFPQINSSGVITMTPYQSGLSYATVVAKSDYGRPYSWAKRGAGLTGFPTGPLGKFNINFPSVSDTEIVTISTFFDQQRGRLNEFIFLDPGANLVPNSEVLSSAPWTGSSVAATGIADPYGGARASTLNASNMTTVVVPAGNLPANFVLCASVWARGLASNISLALGFVSIATQNFTLPQNVWTRLAFQFAINTSSAISMVINWAGAQVQLFGPQVAPMSGPGGYRKTPEWLGLRPHCRFDTDQFSYQARGPNDNVVSLPVTEFWT